MPITFHDIAKLKSAGQPAPAFDDAMERLKTAFWRGEFRAVYFGWRAFFAWYNGSFTPAGDKINITGVPEFESTRGHQRRYVFTCMDNLVPPWLPDIESADDAYDELSRRSIADYPKPLRKIMECVALAKREHRRWNFNQSRPRFSTQKAAHRALDEEVALAETEQAEEIAYMSQLVRKGRASVLDLWAVGETWVDREFDERLGEAVGMAAETESPQITTPKKKIGRRSGSPFAKSDALLHAIMDELIDAGKSIPAAAMEVADRADGGALLESKAKRLENGYRKRQRPAASGEKS